MRGHSQPPARVAVEPLREGMLLGLSWAVLLVPQRKIGSERVSPGKADKVHSVIRKAKFFLNKMSRLIPFFFFLCWERGSVLNLI